MSDQIADAVATEAEGTEPQTEQETETVETLQAKLNQSKEHSRTWEKRAKENAAAAKRLAEFEDAQKTDAEKTADRISKAEAEAASVPEKVSDALRTHLVALHGIEAEDAELYLTAQDPELLLKQVDRLVALTGKRKTQGNVVPREGNTSKNVGGDEREAVRSLFS